MVTTQTTVTTVEENLKTLSDEGWLVGVRERRGGVWVTLINDEPRTDYFIAKLAKHCRTRPY